MINNGRSSFSYASRSLNKLGEVKELNQAKPLVIRTGLHINIEIAH